jgi:hypothetical protein
LAIMRLSIIRNQTHMMKKKSVQRCLSIETSHSLPLR